MTPVCGGGCALSVVQSIVAFIYQVCMNTVQPRIIHHAFKGEGCCRYIQWAEGYSHAQTNANSPQTHLDVVMYAEDRRTDD